MAAVFTLAMGQARFETSYHKDQFNWKQLGIEPILISINMMIFFLELLNSYM